MKIRSATSSQGFAVIIALVAVTVLTLLAGAFAYSMKVETRLAANTNDDEEFYWMARGGVERACWWLALEGGQPFSSRHQYWAGGQGEGPETNGPLAGESLQGFLIGKGTVSLSMEEEESKINVNTADSRLLQQTLTVMNADASGITAVSDSILDWIDPDDNTRPAGAETDYYIGLNPSYNAKNAVIDNIDELLLIKGVTYAMFWGLSSSGATTPDQEHKLGFGHAPGQEPDYAFGLRDVFTPFSIGKVNILTTDARVLQLIPGIIDKNTADAILAARDAEPPIRQVAPLLANAGVPDQVIPQILPYLDVRGSTYTVRATATIGQLSHEYTAVVFRNGATMQVVSFYRSN